MEKRYARHYCSEECRRPPVIQKCATCGKEFRKLPGEVNRKYCSYSCYHKSQGETSIETKMRIFLEKSNLLFMQEKQISRYSIDFYLPIYSMAIEVDGDYWHQDKGKDKKRDKFLNGYGIDVIHFSETEINCDNFEKLAKQRINHLI